MSRLLTITTGRIPPERAEAFQLAYRTLLTERFAQAPFICQSMLVHHGDGVWSTLTMWDSQLALSHRPQRDTTPSAQLFRDFGTEPEIEIADVSAYAQFPRPATATIRGVTAAQQ